MLSPYVHNGEPIKPLGEGPEGQSCREDNDEVETPGRSGWVAKTANFATHRSRRSRRSVTFAKIAITAVLDQC